MLAKPEYFSPPDEVCCWPGVPSGRNLLAKAHKNADFVLEGLKSGIGKSISAQVLAVYGFFSYLLFVVNEEKKSPLK